MPGVTSSTPSTTGSGTPAGEGPDYEQGYYESNHQSGDRIALAFYARVARRLVSRGSTVLEFGSGTGHFSKRLARTFESVAIDVSPYARDNTRATSPSTRVITSLDEVRQGSIDMICSLHVLEHVPRPPETLIRLAALLREGGRLFYVVPDPDGVGHRMRGERWFAYRDPTHISLLRRRRWLDATRAAGFRIDRAGTDGLWDPPYLPRIPARLQLPVFGLPAAVQVAAGRLLLPAGAGECLCVIATKTLRPSAAELRRAPAVTERPS